MTSSPSSASRANSRPADRAAVAPSPIADLPPTRASSMTSRTTSSSQETFPAIARPGATVVHKMMAKTRAAVRGVGLVEGRERFSR